MHRAVLLAGILVTTWSLCGADKATLHFGALLPIGRNPRFFNADVKDTCELALRHINEAPDILPNHTLVMHLNDSKVTTSDSLSVLIIMTLESNLPVLR